MIAAYRLDYANGMPELVLVRHAMPDARPDIPPHRWSLTDASRREARALKSALPLDLVHYVASEERKAIQTLEELADGEPPVIDPDLGEVRRPFEWSNRFRERARAYLRGIDLDGWEPRERVAARFDAAIERHAAVSRAGERTLVVGTHGTALTVWLAHRVRHSFDPIGFWEGLRFPDVVFVDLTSGTLRKIED